MITVSNLSKVYRTIEGSGSLWRYFFARKYKTHQAVKNISFEIAAGELVGFIGPNGAGKTTTLKMLSGILLPTSGNINIMGYSPFRKQHAFLQQLGFVMGQKNQLIWDLPAQDSFLINKAIYQLDNQTYNRNLKELTQQLDCADIITQPVKTLSLGQRMKMELIASLLHKPKLLFLDEPTIGLDIFAQTTIRNFIKDYQVNNQATVMLTSHYMQDVASLAQRVILIDQGKIIFDGKLEQLVEKHSQHKLVAVILGQKPDPAILNQLVDGLEHEYNYPRLMIRIEKERVSNFLAVLTSKLTYVDLNIENEPIEEIVKRPFLK